MASFSLLPIAILEFIVFLFGTFGNLITCYIFLKTKRLHIASCVYVLSLAVADLITCAVLVPIRGLQHLGAFTENQSLAGFGLILVPPIGRVTLLVSFVNLAVLSIDRLIAVSFPFFYRFNLRTSRKCVTIVVLGVWILSIFLTSLPECKAIEPQGGLIIFVSCVMTMTFIMIVSNGRILFVVRRRYRLRQQVKMIHPAPTNQKQCEIKTLAFSAHKKACNCFKDDSITNISLEDKREGGSLRNNIYPESNVIFNRKGLKMKGLRASTPDNLSSNLDSTGSKVTNDDIVSGERMFSLQSNSKRFKQRTNIPPTRSNQRVNLARQYKKTKTNRVTALSLPKLNNWEYKSEKENDKLWSISKDKYIPWVPNVALITRSSEPTYGNQRNHPAKMITKRNSWPGLVHRHDERDDNNSTAKSNEAIYSFRNEGISSSDDLYDPSVNVHVKESPNYQGKTCLTIKEGSSERTKGVRNPRQKSIFISTLIQQSGSREERKTAMSVAIVVLAFIILVYPRISLIFYHFRYPQTPTTSVVRLWLRVLMYANSAINPVLYAWRMQEFRNAFKKLLQCRN